MKIINEFEYDFAISYAGEDLNIAQKIKTAILEKHGNYSVFLAADEQESLVGKDGEKFFEELFTKSKQIIVLLSDNYKRKGWTRFEFELILQRNEENRFIPIKLDDVKILGFPPSIIYLPFSENDIEIADIAIRKLIRFEKENNIHRESDFEKNIRQIKNSRGTLDKSVQLIYDNRERTSPLADVEYPEGIFQKKYTIILEKDSNFSKIKRKVIIINIPADLSKEEVIFNIKHCTVSIFNRDKPEAIGIFVYSDIAHNFLGFDKSFNVAKSDFALYGDWGRAEEGFVYNMPVNKFEYNYNFEESYFDKKKESRTHQNF